ncbi:flavodoxin [Spirochaetia bacterium]|nr:flavodoxin [Spirochaetia bacterium]
MVKQCSFTMVKGFMVAVVLVFFASATVFAQGQNTTRKILVVYFSNAENTDGTDAVSGASVQIVSGRKVGNVQMVAEIIQRTTGGDLFPIQTQNPYPKTHKELLDYAEREKETNTRPILSTHVRNMAEYDTIFLGYPIWWYTLPLAVSSFLEEYNLSGKTIIPFCVHGGSGWANTIEIITKLEPQAVIKDGFTVSRNTVARSERDVTAWLRRLGMVR